MELSSVFRTFDASNEKKEKRRKKKTTEKYANKI